MKSLIALIVGGSFAIAPLSFAQCGGCKGDSKPDSGEAKPGTTSFLVAGSCSGKKEDDGSKKKDGECSEKSC